jgi:hypothetical protein
MVDFTVTTLPGGQISARFTLAQPDGSWSFTSALVMSPDAWAALPPDGRDAQANAQYAGYFAAVTAPPPPDPTRTETMAEGDGNNLSYRYTSDNAPMLPGAVALDYTIGGVLYTGIDDGAGKLIGRYLSGTVDYQTGAVLAQFAIGQAPTDDIILYYQVGG